jgi:hypothetical protein
MTTDDYVALRVWIKEVGFWARQATDLVRYHERMNLDRRRQGNGGDDNKPNDK